MRTKRRSLDSHTITENARAFARHFIRTDLYKRSRDIAVYLSNDNELDLGPFIEHAWTHKKRIYLPVVHGPAFNRMWFALFTEDSLLRPNRYGIYEPIMSLDKMFNPLRLDLVMMPLVGFDYNGNRLGMGGGYYDRTFTFLRYRTSWQRPFLVGVAYDFQEVAQLPSDSWDIPMKAVATESRFLSFK